MKIFHVIVILLLVIIAIPTVAQRKKNTVKADSAFNSGDYSKAIERYTKLYPKISNKEQKAEVSFKLAESYRHMNDIKKAKSYYKRAVKAQYSNPIATLRLADCMRIDGEYEDALIEYNDYISLAPDDPLGKIGKESCEAARQWIKNPSRYTVLPMKDINSKQDDNAPVIVGDDELIISSTRDGAIGSKLNSYSGQSFSDLWYTRKDNKEAWSIPVQISGAVNTPGDEGVASINSDKNTIYYTYAEGGKKVFSTVKIFSSTKDGDLWAKPVELILFKDSSIDVAHPSISEDELTLYFASNYKDKSVGGYDIWMAKRKSKSDKWDKPQNLGGDINTSGNELFPYIHSDGTLYFSSNGRVGMGGLDIYKAELSPEGKWLVENMQYPINSSADDFGITFNQSKYKGYLSSTRKVDDTRGGDDIFEFSLPPLEFSLSIKVIDSEMGMPLPGTKIKLYGSDGTLVSAETNADGIYVAKLKENSDYRALAERENYLKGKGKQSTKGLKESKALDVLIPIEPLGIEIKIENIFYEFTKAELREESYVELDKLLEKMTDNPDVSFEIMSHTDFRGDNALNDKLSQERAQSVIDYLTAKGIAMERLAPVGYGETMPKKVDEKLAEKYDFLNVDDVLDEKFITALKNEEQQEICHQINRRTEFKAIASGDRKKTFYFGPDRNEAPKDDDGDDEAPQPKDKK